MLGQQGKGEIDLECTEVAFPDYPDLLFGDDDKTGRTFFDGTIYINAKKADKSIKLFFVQWGPQIKAVCDAFGLDASQACLINKQGHYLIDANILCLFISYVEPIFLAQVCDRVYELMQDGVAVTDAFLAKALQTRLSPEMLKSLLEDDNAPDKS